MIRKTLLKHLNMKKKVSELNTLIRKKQRNKNVLKLIYLNLH